MTSHFYHDGNQTHIEPERTDHVADPFAPADAGHLHAESDSGAELFNASGPDAQQPFVRTSDDAHAAQAIWVNAGHPRHIAERDAHVPMPTSTAPQQKVGPPAEVVRERLPGVPS